MLHNSVRVLKAEDCDAVVVVPAWKSPITEDDCFCFPEKMSNEEHKELLEEFIIWLEDFTDV